MTENIKSIFEHNIRLLGDTDKAVFYFREQQYDKGLSIFANSIDQIKYVLEAIITDRAYFNLVATEAVLEMLSKILEAKKNRDYILLADLLELQLVSFLCGVQELIVSREEILFDEENYKENIQLLLEKGVDFPLQMKEPINTTALLQNGYRVEFTSSGLMTLAAENEGFNFYFHTNSRVQLEAFLLASRWKRERKKRYVLYGFGMGYHINELLNLVPEAEIEVYEADLNVMQLACAFTDVKEIIKKDRITLFYDPDLELLKKRISLLTQEEALLLHYPSIKNIRNVAAKKILETMIPWSKTIESC